MVYYPIQTLVNAGITEIIVVTGGPHAGDFLHVLKNGDDFGIKHVEYAYQEGEGGIAQALSLCKDFVGKDNVTVILGDNCTDANIKKEVASFKEGSMVFLKEVIDPERFGVPVFDKGNNIIRIDEKPKNPSNNYAVTGLYMYDSKVFDYISMNKPSDRGELEITDVNNRYIEDGKMRWAKLQGFWSDAGTFESLYRTNVFWTRKRLGLKKEKEITSFDS